MAEEQAALGRVATLVAHGAAPEELFAAVTKEVGLLLGASLAGMGRYESDDTVTVLTAWAAEGEQHPLVAGPWPLEGGDVASTVFRTGTSVRIGDYQGFPGRIAAFVRDELGIGSSVASPIVVEGRLWGVLYPACQADRTGRSPGMPNRAWRTSRSWWRRRSRTPRAAPSWPSWPRSRRHWAACATLVARGVPPEEVFAAVTEEVGRLVYVDYAGLGRYESGRYAHLRCQLGQGGRLRSRWQPVERRREGHQHTRLRDRPSGPDRQLCRGIRDR